MKKKKNQVKVGENISSGAEKVESIARKETPENIAVAQEVTSTGMSAPASQNTAAYSYAAERTTPSPADGEKLRLTAAQKEAQAARRRVQKAVAKKEREEQKAAYHEEKKARAKRDKREDKKRTRGIGGWIAAVVALGTTTLALTTVVAVGVTTMERDKNSISAVARGVLYEFVGTVEEMEECLDEARIVTSQPLQSQLLTGALTQARMAEGDLEKLPFDAQQEKNLTTYLNTTAYFCEGMLAKLRQGEGLSLADEKMLDGLHDVSEKVSERLGVMLTEMEDKDMLSLLSGKECCIGEAMSDLEEITLPRWKDERRIPPRSKESPSMEGRGESTLTSSQAKEYVLQYFADYGVKDVVCDGETVSRRLCAYNFTMTDEKGTAMFAQIDEKDGALVSFACYEPCTEKRIDEETCLKKATAFLEKLGYEQMQAVDLSAEGTNLDIVFASTVEDVVDYSKEVTVKVCMERGRVVGLNAEKYLENKGGRVEFTAQITLQEAYEGLDEKLTVESSRPVLIPYRGKTYSAYEFFCSFDGGYYFVYTDAGTGNQLFVKQA